MCVYRGCRAGKQLSPLNLVQAFSNYTSAQHSKERKYIPTGHMKWAPRSIAASERGLWNGDYFKRKSDFTYTKVWTCPDDAEKPAGSQGHICHLERARGELPSSWLPWEEPPAPPSTHTQTQKATWVFLSCVFESWFETKRLCSKLLNLETSQDWQSNGHSRSS